MVGGDNASRGIAIGMVLGAYQGVDAISQAWKKNTGSMGILRKPA
jgi:ADP-ribosylglycohydrolase